MMTEVPPPDFDQHADHYDDALNEGLRVSGETKDFFAGGRIGWLATCCHELGVEPRKILDYGCGIGSATDLLFQLGAESLIGVDRSSASLDVARAAHSDRPARYLTPDQYAPDGSVDLVYTNGVFHHIPPDQRRSAVEFLGECLTAGGLLAFWENNPWNPGTRYVMSRIPFDADAVMLGSGEVRVLVRAAGFEVIHTTYHFIFPRVLGFLRGLERPLMRVPLGAQYQVLCRKR